MTSSSPDNDFANDSNIAPQATDCSADFFNNNQSIATNYNKAGHQPHTNLSDYTSTTDNQPSDQQNRADNTATSNINTGGINTNSINTGGINTNSINTGGINTSGSNATAFKPAESSDVSNNNCQNWDLSQSRTHFGMLGILEAFRHANLHSTFIGVDPTSLGLNLDSSTCLYESFTTPWATNDAPSTHRDVMRLPTPPSFLGNWAIQKLFNMRRFKSYNLDTLFYIFYNFPRHYLQGLCAIELSCRGWLYHPDTQKWYIPIDKQQRYEEGSLPCWQVFDHMTWSRQFTMDVNASQLLQQDLMVAQVEDTFRTLKTRE